MDKETSENKSLFDLSKNADSGIKETASSDLKELEIDTSELQDMRNSATTPDTQDTFDSLPEVATDFSVDEISSDPSVEAEIENAAIAALPRAESLDSILYGANDDDYTPESEEETRSFENSLADYRKAMKAAFSAISSDEDDEQPPLLVKDKAAQPMSAPTKKVEDADILPTENIETYYVEEYSSSLVSDSEEETDVTAPLEFAEQETEKMVIDFGDIPIEPECEEEASEQEEVYPRPVIARGAEKYDPDKPRKIDGVFETVELFIFTLIAVLILATFFFRHSVVDGKSMDDTLADGEHLIITDFLYTPRRGDIIVFEDREANINTPYIKRVIGIPGDTVKIESDGSVYVNGVLLEEDYVTHRPIKDKELTCTVGEGELFVMGDQRRVSEDSRSFGVINDDGVLGKVILRIYPFSKFGTVE